ncbi:hypothetical protein GCM10011611_03220 [Aliidongia dinghuensis]|uniref:KfrA N-terminal DNA-binding domain-containing protein n=1 Tax=Aliidongia dinghuensis TaxID=1867774 RepID=A0A8J2YQI3_9PROT|nr:DNA-binding protein [Aliidongia dinghuensis]GGF00999.1 hypothetical protein GCM10011611_03220 [Aliidongia dinghuensis]
MGRPAEFSDDQIIQAGLELEREGGGRLVPPSVIRDRLGGGNTRRIAQIWGAFLKNRELEAARAKAAKAELPMAVRRLLDDERSSLEGRLVVLCGDIYAAAQQEQHARQAVDLEALKRELAESQQKLDAAYADNDAMFEAKRAAETAMATMTAELAEQYRRADRAEGQAAAIEGMLTAARAENAQLLERAARAEAALDRLTPRAPGEAVPVGANLVVGRADLRSGA